MSRRLEILDALLDIFKNQGVNKSFTIKELADKVDIGKSTIYEYFETKEELLNQAFERLVKNSAEQLFAIDFDPSLSFEASIKRELTYLLNLALESCSLTDLVNPGINQALPDNVRDTLRNYATSLKQHYYQRFNQIFEKGIAAGELSLINVEENQFAISSLIAGSILSIGNQRDQNIPMKIDDLVEKIYHALLKIVT